MNGMIYPIGGGQKDSAVVAHNLLMNSQFLINERFPHITSSFYPKGDGEFISDRWRVHGCEDGEGKGNELQILNYSDEYHSSNPYDTSHAGNGIGCFGGRCQLEQRFLPGKVIENGKTYSVLAMLSDGTVIDTGTVGSATDGTYDYCRVPLSAGQIVIWTALYEGTYTKDNYPAYRPRSYAEEYAECARYFYRHRNRLSFYYDSANYNSNMYRFIVNPNLTFPSPMIKSPQIDGLLGGFYSVLNNEELNYYSTVDADVTKWGLNELQFGVNLTENAGFYYIQPEVLTFDAEDF